LFFEHLYQFFQLKLVAVVLRLNTTIYCANFKLAKQYVVCDFLNATALLIISLIRSITSKYDEI